MSVSTLCFAVFFLSLVVAYLGSDYFGDKWTECAAPVFQGGVPWYFTATWVLFSVICTAITCSTASRRKSNRDRAERDVEPGLEPDLIPEPLSHEEVPASEPLKVDWDSVWRTLYVFGHFLGSEATVRGFSIYSTYSPTPDQNCATTDAKSQIAWWAFVVLYITPALLFLETRRSRDDHPYYIKTYCQSTLCGEHKSFIGHLQTISLLLIFWVLMPTVLAASYLSGETTPKKMQNALSFVGCQLGILSILMFTLEVDVRGDGERFMPSIEYHWLWSLVCLFIVWSCGVTFYFSVYGFQEPLYYVPHVVCACLLLWVTMYRRELAFPKLKEKLYTA